MSVTTSQSRIAYTGDGATVIFPFPYLFQNNADIEVWVNNVQMNSGFTTTGASNASLPTVGGQVEFVNAPAIGASVVLFRNSTTLQKTVLAPNDPFPAKTVETALDAAMLAIQRLYDILALQPDENQLPVALSYPFQESTLSGTLPVAAARAGGLLGFDANGLPTILPVTASVGAGNMTSEGPFAAGPGFTPGTTTQLTLSQDYVNSANVDVHFDSAYQGTDQYAIVGNQIIFTAPIPVGVSKVYVVGGTTLSVGTPPASSVGDTQLQWSNILSRVCATVAAVAALNPIFYQEAFATGFAAQGDGGGGAYYFSQSSTATVDNATVLPSASGTGRWILNVVGRLSVKQCGAKGDGVTDDTGAAVIAHATLKPIYYPASTYLVSKYSIAAGGIIGDGTGQTFILTSDTAANDCLTLTGSGFSSGVVLRDFCLKCGAYNQKSGGNGINFVPGSAENQFALVDNVVVLNFPSGLEYTAASSFTVRSCKFVNYTTQGMLVQNTNVADSGDSFCYGNLFNTSVPTGLLAGIVQVTSGGLKFWGNKILGGTIGFLMNAAGNNSTSDLNINGNSIEVSTYGILFERSSGTIGWSSVNICNNQIGLSAANGAGIIYTDAGAWLSHITCNDNVIALGNTGQTCISFGSLAHFTIIGNNLNGNGFGTTTGISIQSTCSNGKIGKQVYSSLTTPIANASTSVFIDFDRQSGNKIVTTGSALGSLFSGSQAVTFAPAFASGTTPTVKPTVVGTSGNGISAAASSITNTGFVLSITGTTSGGTPSANWDADGIYAQ